MWYIAKAEATELEGPDYEDAPTDEPDHSDWVAAVKGRASESKPPRFNIDELKPWEIMFADEKEYPTTQCGVTKTSFILLEMKSDGWFFKAEHSQTQPGDSFRKIMIENGVHLLSYPRTIYTDGCVYVRDMAISVGINYIAISPHSQSLNEAERIADRLWACARIQMISTEAQDNHFAYGMDMACYAKLRMATTAYCNWLTPYAILRGARPSIAHLRPFFTKAFVTVPKTKRAKMKEWGHDQPHKRAEIGHLIGYQDLWGSTARVLLDRNRVVHSNNITYDSQAVTNPTPAPAEDRGE